MKQYKDAMRFSTNNEVGSPTMDTIVNWANNGKDKMQAWHNGTDIFVQTLHGEEPATVGDYIVRGMNDEYYPCKPDVFEATHEQVY